ncbi:MAG: ATP-binding protein [Nitrososphaeria archaeon]|jgi:PAS domain S-box-containing protein
MSIRNKDFQNQNDVYLPSGISEERFRRLAENADDLIFLYRPEEGFEYVNSASTKILGYTPKEHYNDKNLWWKIIHPDDAPKLAEMMVQSPNKKGHIRQELRWKRKDGRLVWTEQVNIPVSDPTGKLIVLEGIGRDITERKRIEEKLRKHTEHLEEIVDERTKELKEAERIIAIGQVSTMVGHDLRNPLQVLVNLLYLAETRIETLPLGTREVVKREGLDQLIVACREQIDYMNKIVLDLQDFGRPIEPVFTIINMRQLIVNALSMVNVPENVKVAIDISDGFPFLMVDSLMMKRVFVNLFNNAVQAMPDGGKLTVRGSVENDMALISVQDTGVGIPKENFHKLFTPLFTTKSKGQGLGLSVCKRLIEIHNGSIDFESKVGAGSTFTVKIPRSGVINE